MNELESNDHQDDPNREIEQPPTPVKRAYPAVNDTIGGNHRNKKQTNWPQRIEAVCAVLLVIITGFYTYYAAGQLHKMKRSVEAAEGANKIARDALRFSQDAAKDSERSFRLQQRPYIFVVGIDPSTPLKEGMNTLVLTMRNTGRTPV